MMRGRFVLRSALALMLVSGCAENVDPGEQASPDVDASAGTPGSGTEQEPAGGPDSGPGQGSAGANVDGGEASSPRDPDAGDAPEATPRGKPFVVLTTPSTPFQRRDIAGSPTTATTRVDVRLSSARRQVIQGFGGAFNEQGWDALSVLSAEARDAVLSAIFGPSEGLRLTVGRVPIGASDYATSRYTNDEFPGDYEMKHFNIDRDRQKLLPYIKAAMRFQPKLLAWGSAWTPPTWMKTPAGFDSGAMIDDARIYDAYALYLSKFVEAYRAEGVDLFMVVPQNEPGQLTNYPSCDWKPEQYLKFVRDHAGPLFAKRKPGAELWVGTINTSTFDVAMTLRDPKAYGYLGGLCLQWGGLDQLGTLRGAYPELPIMQSETQCGNNYWEPGYNPDKAPNDFAYAATTWRNLQKAFAGGVSSYMLWNIVLDQHGKNIDSKSPWPQNSAVVVDTASKRVTYTPMFYATEHFSGLIDPGAKLVATSPDVATAIAFENPSGTRVVELLNDTTTEQTWNVDVEGTSYMMKLPAQAFATLVVP